MKPVVLVIFLLVSLLHAQETRVPMPALFAGGALEGGGGYAPVAAQGAFRWEVPMRRLTFAAEGSYTAVRKSNDGTGTNPKGRDRELGAGMRLMLPHYWFAGPVFDWGELSTSNYQKSAWHPGFGGGRDFGWMRLSADYLLAGSDHSNGSQGPVVDTFFPSPARGHGHFFLRERISLYRFHQTVTDPTDADLTRTQLAAHSWASSSEITLGFRF
jgi:hypothetical protein